MTRHPARRNVRFTSRSLVLFPASFFFQKARLFAGLVTCRGQPCQKQPSTNSASRTCLNTKSGRTQKTVGRVTPCAPFLRSPQPARDLSESAIRTSECLLHPVIPFARNSFASASSVSRLPRERIRDITSERFRFEKTSAMNRAWRCFISCSPLHQKQPSTSPTTTLLPRRQFKKRQLCQNGAKPHRLGWKWIFFGWIRLD